QSSDELVARFSNIRGPDGKRVCGLVKSAEIAEGPANEMECARLRLQPEDRVVRINRVRHHKGQVFLVEDVSLPAALFPGLAEKKAITDRIIVWPRSTASCWARRKSASRSPGRRRR